MFQTIQKTVCQGRLLTIMARQPLDQGADPSSSGSLAQSPHPFRSIFAWDEREIIEKCSDAAMYTINENSCNIESLGLKGFRLQTCPAWMWSITEPI